MEKHDMPTNNMINRQVFEVGKYAIEKLTWRWAQNSDMTSEKVFNMEKQDIQ